MHRYRSVGEFSGYRPQSHSGAVSATISECTDSAFEVGPGFGKVPVPEGWKGIDGRSPGSTRNSRQAWDQFREWADSLEPAVEIWNREFEFCSRAREGNGEVQTTAAQQPTSPRAVRTRAGRSIRVIARRHRGSTPTLDRPDHSCWRTPVLFSMIPGRSEQLLVVSAPDIWAFSERRNLIGAPNRTVQASSRRFLWFWIP